MSLAWCLYNFLLHTGKKKNPCKSKVLHDFNSTFSTWLHVMLPEYFQVTDLWAPLMHQVTPYFQALLYVLSTRHSSLLCSTSQIPLIFLGSTSTPLAGTLSMNMDVNLTLSRHVSLPCRGSTANGMGPWGQEESQNVALFHLIPIWSRNWSW